MRLLDQAIEFRAQPLDLGGWVQRAVANRPEILGIQHQIQKSELNIAFTRNRLLPALDLTASYSRFDTGSGFGRVIGIREQEWAIGLVFSVPIGNAAARAELRKAEIGHAQLREVLTSRQRQVELEVRSSVIKLVRSSERIRALRTAIQQAEEKLDVAKTQFSLGLITNFDITDAQEDLRTANVDLLGAIVDYNIGLAELEARIAGPIY